MNVRLAVRGADGVTLTEAGRAMTRCTVDVLERISEMSREIGQSLGGQTGRVRVSANTSALMLGLNEDLAKFRCANAGIQVSLSEHVSAQVVADVQGGRTDIGICASGAVLENVTALPYRSCSLVLAVPVGHPLAKQKLVRYESTRKFSNVGRSSGSALAALAPVSPNGKATNEIDTSVHSFDAVIELVRTGGMIGLLPSIVLERRPAPGVVAVGLDEPWARFDLVVCYDATVLHRPPVLMLFNWLASRTSLSLSADR